ncbi:MAG TPA: ribulose-phosphate 3-epimerase [Desulfobacterales bacterium]|nr:ribulose-phosphate 3-epimerase [Desulfobacterales bacterium]
MNMKLLAPSLLSADFSKLKDEIRAVEAAGADWLHLDVMDGHFVPNITLGPIIVQAVDRLASLPLDVHLMVEEPDCYIPAFAKAGASFISVQVEACTHLNRTIHRIKESGSGAGVALNPTTDLSSIEWILESVDFILIMSVNPGFGGQVFIPNALEKIRRLRSMIQDRELPTRIEVDGGVNEQNIEEISSAGADIFVAGSAVFGSQDYTMTINSFRKKIGP